MTVFAGLDYSLRSLHVALLDGRELLGPTEHRLGRDAKSQAGIITRLAMDLQRLHGPVSVYLERPWLGLNVQTLVDLSLLVGAIRGIFIASGHSVELVAPDAWRASVSMKAAGRDRASKKEAAVRTVEVEFHRRVTHDEADSILLAVYGARQAKQATALAGAR